MIALPHPNHTVTHRYRLIAGALISLSLLLQTGCRTHVAPTLSPITQSGTPNTLPSRSATTSQPTVIAADPRWFACQTQQDCIVTQGPCAEPQAVNTHFLRPFINFRNQLNQAVGCQPARNLPDSHAAQCQKHRCSLPASPQNHS